MTLQKIYGMLYFDRKLLAMILKGEERNGKGKEESKGIGKA